jgi:hypothetical protein
MTRPTNIQTQGSTTAKQSPVLTKDVNQTPFQRLVSAIDWVRKKDATDSKKAEKFYGIVLASTAIPLAKFSEKYPEATSFYRSVIQKEGKVIKPKKDSYIIKAHCYVPEVSGILPFPEYETYNRYLCLYNGTDQPTLKDGQSQEQFQREYQEYRDKTQKEIVKIYPKLFKEFQKIVMHPLFYKYMESESQPTPYQFVGVKYTKDFDTLHTGVIESIHGAYFSG